MKDEKLYRGYKVRLFPTQEQEELMIKHINTCRFVWNYMLEIQTARYKINNKKYIEKYDMCKEITYMKKEKEYEFLKETPLHSMQQVCNDLDEAFKMFFNKIHKYPKFKKSKGSKISFPLDPDKRNTYFKNENTFHVQKVGDVFYKTKFNIPIGRGSKICDPQIQYIKSSKKWILTFSLECDKQTPELTNESVGIDLGIKELAVVAVGDKKLVFHNINKSKRIRALKKKEKHIQRAISRKRMTINNKGHCKKGETWEESKSIKKYEQILHEIRSKMANIRKNYIHQITRQLVNMLPNKVVMETLNIQGMVKNKYLAESISEQNFYFFIQTMKYKCEEYSIEFIQVPMFYPSSKTCSDCGRKKKDLKLSDRVYKCPVCGLEIDRDYNAAINLMNYTENKTTTDKLVTKVERKKKASKAKIVSVA